MSSGTRLFVGNLPENTNENELRSAFSSYGEITGVDLKSKSGSTEEQKKFAFVTISSSNLNIESCIKHFSNEDFKGARLYVTRARESFLERLQRERQETQKKEENKEKLEELPKKNPIIKLSDKLNPRKRKSDVIQSETNHGSKFNKPLHKQKYVKSEFDNSTEVGQEILSEGDKKKKDSDKKRLESMKKKRQEFKEKQMIIKTGLTSVDKTPNKKVIFSDNDDDITPIMNGEGKKSQKHNAKNTLFDDNDESEDDVNFEIKQQFEGKKGQKVLDLQSRYKSDKRFILDERFIDGDQSETEEQKEEENEEIELEQVDEKKKQLNILQDVLGVAIKTKIRDQDNAKSKTKIGMLRFDPLQPDHAKFLMPLEEKKQEIKKSKKKNKDKKDEVEEQSQEFVEEKVEVSKEQFYKVSETLKEAIAQPTSFSLRSLFTRNEDDDNAPQDQEMNYIPLEKPSKPKVKNPLDPGEKNPFVYDSSDSEAEEEKEVKINPATPQPEPKAVWKENLFFSSDDTRLKEALIFFNKPIETDVQKERRELKSLMKKRIYNKERKSQMFQKKIGGRKKTMKKSYNKNKSKHS
ncbi:hypothetical protein O3G_MSEX009939 [Manduca sexta]|uniref:RRM domain-containing protein n=1 Tax=Manduca sexta TaxID=7130 RepID=A0A922CSS0_MANSE|nr:hypothetical protein O3G_MSEX009939 [Manduca sexta]